MNTGEIQNLIKELVEKVNVVIKEITVLEENSKTTWFAVEVSEPHYFIDREGEALHALNHLVNRIIDAQKPATEQEKAPSILIDINNFQKKRVDNIRAIAHMMAERARYFKSNIEVDPMSSFERRIVHEFLADQNDLSTESIGEGRLRRVVIKYIGNL